MKILLTLTAVAVTALIALPAAASGTIDLMSDSAGADELLLAQADLQSMQAGDLVGLTVITENQLELGDIQAIARQNNTGDLYAIVTVGDYWAAYGFNAALPLSEMSLVDGQMMLHQERADIRIDRDADTYDAEDYTPLESDASLVD